VRFTGSRSSSYCALVSHYGGSRRNSASKPACSK
jgi:hypothetical protein